MKLIITPDDIEVSYLSGGPGGQHQNKHMNGVRLRHKEYPVEAVCRSYRSRKQNYDSAIKVLRSRLYALLSEAPDRHGTDAGFGAEGVVRTYNLIENYAKDAQTGLRHQIGRSLDDSGAELIESRLMNLSSSE